MTTFAPTIDMSLTIGSQTYQFMPHPHFSDEVFVMEGGEAFLYQLQEVMHGTLYALKIMKPVYRSEQCVRVAVVLQQHKDLPGFFLGNRLCLRKARFPQIVARYPELEYATLMPWLPGRTWAGFLLDHRASAHYTTDIALELAAATASVLQHLESLHFAHTDIAGSNIIILPNFRQVELLDFEGLSISGMPASPWHSYGSPGYQHRKLDTRGQSRLEGDRFAGAILLTEMLTWWNPLVRAHTSDDAESLFEPDALQTTNSPRWHAVRNTLWTLNPDLLHLFDQAWASSDLTECPELSSWASCLPPASNL
jgi:serine/threonine protein kinase